MAIKNIDKSDYQDLYETIENNWLINWYQHAIKYKFVIPIFRYAKKDSSILDIGCARGAFLGMLQKAGYTNLSGLDVDNALSRSVAEKVTFYKESIYDPQLNIGKYNHVHMASVLHHLPISELKQVAINLSKSVVEKGGYLYIYDVNRKSLFGKLHNNVVVRLTSKEVYTANELERPEQERFSSEWRNFVEFLSKDFQIIKRNDRSIYVSLVARRK